MDTSRTQLLIGDAALSKLQNANVCIVGIGGVGGYAAELIARAGVEKLTLIDFDSIQPSNLNRQIIALESTISKNKAEVMAERILSINKNAKINVVKERLSVDNIEGLIEKFDYVADCIDSITNKKDLIVYCKNKKIPIVSAMGAGNRCAIPEFKAMDIYKTSNDGLAKIMRKLLRESCIESHTVISTSQPVEKNQTKTVASISYYPAMCGAVLAGYVINELIKEN